MAEIFDAISDGIFTLDPDMTVTFFSHAAERLLGRRRKEVLGRHLFEAFPEAKGSIFEEKYTWALEKKKPVSFETYFDQEPYENWYDTRVYPYENGISVIFQVTTEQKRVQESLTWESGVNAVLAELAQQLLSPASIEEISQRVLEHVKHLTGSAFGYVGYIDPGTGYLVCPTMTRDISEICQVPDKDIVFKEFGGLWGWVLDNRESLLTNTPADDPRSSGTPQGHISIQRFVSSPAMIGDELVGQVAVANSERDYTPQDLDLLERLADLYAIAIRRSRTEAHLRELNATLETRVQRRTFELQVLYELSQEIGYTLDYDELFRLMLTHLHRAVPHDVAAGVLLIGEQCELFIRPTRPLAPSVRETIRQRLVSVFSRMAARGRDLQPEDAAIRTLESDEMDESVPVLPQLDSGFQVPLIVGEERETIGLLFVGAEGENQFTEEHVRLLYTVANQASASIQRLRALLAAEQQRLESLVGNLPEGVLLLDVDRRLLVINPVARECLDTLSNARWGQVLTHLGERPIDEFLSPPPPGMWHELEIDGPPRQFFEIGAQPMETGLDEQGWVLVIRDVTQEQAIQQHVQQQERMAAVGQMAAGIAHDFNNIVASIVLYSGMMLRKPDLTEADKNRLETIREQGHRASALVRQILDFSRRSVIERQPLDLIPFLKEMKKLLARTLPETIDLHLHYDSDECVVNADPTRMQQMMMNLAVNARDAMPGGGELHFDLHRFRVGPADPPPLHEMQPGNWVRMRIVDTGEGIAPEHLTHIFEPFFTTKEQGKGTGLGLAQVYGIVEQHEGFVRVESETGEGTTFTIYLPTLASKTFQPMPEEEETLVEGEGETILLVEDDDAARDALSEVLASLNYRVLTAKNGRKALSIFEENDDEIALVLSDLVMPQMGGLELHTALKKKHPHVKMIVTTGYPLADGGKELLEQGIVNWMKKPLSAEKIATALRRALDGEDR